uniref:Universal stress protein n=1 Tax=Candidatus Desulfatibia profunda TaxID=2841695 RepID=A0A8J6NU62_9BACT|nr:universal stress protein [Candidatus Desulfatibia profunda]
MERILVGMDPKRTSRWAGVYALNLAKRIQAKVSFLLVIDPAAKRSKPAISNEAETSVKESLESLIEEGLSEGILVDYYIAYGQYEDELVNFIKDNQISILVVGSPADQKASAGNFKSFLEKIRHRVDCRIEVVHEKTT